MRKNVTEVLRYVLLPLAALLGGLLLGRGSRPAPVNPVVRTDTVSVERWRTETRIVRAATEEQRADRSGENGVVQQALVRLQGLEARQPESLTVTDSATEVEAPQVVVDGRGRLTLHAVFPDSSGELRGHTARGIRVGDCDDGWRMDGVTTICNRARLGHLRVFVGLGAEAPTSALRASPRSAPLTPLVEGGLEWRPTYRSPHTVEIRGTPHAISLQARLGVSLF